MPAPVTTMLDTLRRSRRLIGALLLGVWVALLPMRGWAEVALHAAWPAGPAPAALAAASPPCHGEPATPAEDAGPAGQAGMAAGAPHASDPGTDCALCVLCHAPAMPADETRLALEAPVSATAGTAVRDHAPPLLPLPERPPRS